MSLVLVLNSFRGLLRSFLRVDLSTTPILALGGKETNVLVITYLAYGIIAT